MHRQTAHSLLLMVCILVSLLEPGCTLVPRNGQVLERRSDSFELTVLYPADHPAREQAVAVAKQFSKVAFVAFAPGAPTDATADALLPDIGEIDLSYPAEILRAVEVNVGLRGPTPPVVINATSNIGIRCIPSVQVACPLLDVSFMTQANASLTIDVTGATLIVLKIPGVTIPQSLWAPCAGSGVICPTGANFFARVTSVVRYPGDNSGPFIPSPPAARAGTFDNTPVVNACILQFPTIGGLRVFDECSNKNVGFATIFAQQ